MVRAYLFTIAIFLYLRLGGPISNLCIENSLSKTNKNQNCHQSKQLYITKVVLCILWIIPVGLLLQKGM